MPRHRRLVSLLLATLALGSLTFALSSCGYSSDSKQVSEGESVGLGHLKYTVVFSRSLNPSDNEDSAYLVGQSPLPEGSSYFGVFFQVQNNGSTPQPLPQSLKIVDATKREYKALPSESLYAFPLGGEVEPEEQVPVLDSTPQQGPIEGSMVLFELPAEASSNRPLTLFIPGPEGPAEVTLDL
jgi:hypothetical protein